MDKSVLAAKGGRPRIVSWSPVFSWNDIRIWWQADVAGTCEGVPREFPQLERPDSLAWNATSPRGRHGRSSYGSKGLPLNGTCRWTCPRTASVTVFGASRTRPRRIALARHCQFNDADGNGLAFRFANLAKHGASGIECVTHSLGGVIIQRAVIESFYEG